MPFIPLDEVTARAARGRKHRLVNLTIDLVQLALDIAKHESNFNRYTPNILAAIITGFLMTTAE